MNEEAKKVHIPMPVQMIETLRIECPDARKAFDLQLGMNPRGGYARVTECAGDRKTSLVVPGEALEPMADIFKRWALIERPQLRSAQPIEEELLNCEDYRKSFEMALISNKWGMCARITEHAQGGRKSVVFIPSDKLEEMATTFVSWSTSLFSTAQV